MPENKWTNLYNSVVSTAQEARAFPGKVVGSAIYQGAKAPKDVLAAVAALETAQSSLVPKLATQAAAQIAPKVLDRPLYAPTTLPYESLPDIETAINALLPEKDYPTTTTEGIPGIRTTPKATLIDALTALTDPLTMAGMGGAAGIAGRGGGAAIPTAIPMLKTLFGDKQ